MGEMTRERGLAISSSCVWRWVQAYGPELDKRCWPYLKPTNRSWRVDETFIKVKGQERFRKLPYGSMDREPARSYRTRAASSKARSGELQFRLWARLKSFDQLLVSRNDDLSVSTTTGFQLVSAIYEVDNWRESF
jgi:hypothetical protein